MSVSLIAAVMMDDMPAYAGSTYTQKNRVLAFSSWGMLAPTVTPTGKTLSFIWGVVRRIC